MWSRVWSLAPILSPLYCAPVEGGRHVEEGLELGPHPPGEQVFLLVQNLHNIVYLKVEGGRHVEEGLKLGPHPPGEQVFLLVQNLHYIVYLLKVAAMWRSVWSLAPSSW
jgi:hypothetical protein